MKTLSGVREAVREGYSAELQVQWNSNRAQSQLDQADKLKCQAGLVSNKRLHKEKMHQLSRELMNQLTTTESSTT